MSCPALHNPSEAGIQGQVSLVSKGTLSLEGRLPLQVKTSGQALAEPAGSVLARVNSAGGGMRTERKSNMTLTTVENILPSHSIHCLCPQLCPLQAEEHIFLYF